MRRERERLTGRAALVEATTVGTNPIDIGKNGSSLLLLSCRRRRISRWSCISFSGHYPLLSLSRCVWKRQKKRDTNWRALFLSHFSVLDTGNWCQVFIVLLRIVGLVNVLFPLATTPGQGIESPFSILFFIFLISENKIKIAKT